MSREPEKDDAMGRPETDADFDRALARALEQPGDADVALMSRAVLNALAEAPAPARGPGAEVLAEPLPWVAGFAGMLLLFAGLGYAAVPLLDGGVIHAVAEMGDVLTLMGGR